jgi:cell wall-associated NlpC family hydrolase
MPSASGLSLTQRILCRERAVQAAKLAYKNKAQVHYTEGPDRWLGITNKRDASLGEYAHYADCSSFVTWCLWNGLGLLYGTPDVVNAAQWKGGYTGTMYENGMVVQDLANVLRGDCVLYGPRPGAHVAIVVGRMNGTLMVISHGSEPAPFYLAYNYRSDVHQIRRYI